MAPGARARSFLAASWALWLAIPLIGVAACFEAQTEGAPVVSVRGDTTVFEAAAPVHPEGGELVPDLTIGMVEGPEEYLFGAIGDVAVGPLGTVYVLDGQAQIVRAFAPDGSYLRNIGGRGEGPGEFQAAAFLAVAPDGRVLVADDRTLDVEVFAADGEPLETWTIRHRLDAPIVFEDAGTALVPLGRLPLERSMRWGDLGRVSPGGPRSISVVRGTVSADPPLSLRIQRGGSVVDTVPAPQVPESGNYLEAQGRGGRIYMTFDYRLRSWWSLTPLGYSISGVTDRFAVDLHLAGSAGDSIVSLRWRGERVGIPSGLQEVLQRQVDTMMTSSALQWAREETIPETKPAYHRVLVGQDGRLWVRVYVPSVVADAPGEDRDTWHEPESAFDVLEPDGRYLGTVRGPAGLRATWAQGDTLMVIASDELGVNVVRRMIVKWEGE